MKKIITILLSLLMIVGTTAAVYAASPADGTYSVSVSVSGGTGRATIKSPSTLTVSGGKMKAKVVWNSENYTWMKVGGVQYNNENSGGNSTFTIPVSALDTPIAVSAETVAMSEPHVIDYTVTFSSSGVKMNEDASSSGTSSSEAKPPKQEKPDVSTKDEPTSESQEEDEQSDEETAETSDVISVDNKFSSSTSISGAALSDYEGKTLHISTVNGEVAFDKAATEYIATNAEDGVTLTMEDVSDKNEDYALAVDVKIKDGTGKDLFADGKSGKASVKLNFDKGEAKVENLKVYNISNDKKEEVKATYDEEVGTVSFDTESLGIYGVSVESKSGSGTVTIIVVAAVLAVAAVGATVFFKKRKAK